MGASQASDPLSFMHPPLVVPDALRLSGLAALSGVPLQSSSEQALRSAVASAPSPLQPRPQQQQQQQQQQQSQSRQTAAAASNAPLTPAGRGGVGAAADGDGARASAPPAAARRLVEQPAAPEREAKRRRTAEQRPAADVRFQEQQRQDEPSTVVTSVDVPPGDAEALQGGGAVSVETGSAVLSAGNPGAVSQQAEPMEVDGAEAPSEVCSSC